MNCHDCGSSRWVKGIKPLQSVNQGLRHSPPSMGDKDYDETPGLAPVRQLRLPVQICLRRQKIVWGRINISTCTGSPSRGYPDLYMEQVELSAHYAKGSPWSFLQFLAKEVGTEIA